jgi:hypothetical protein
MYIYVFVYFTYIITHIITAGHQSIGEFRVAVSYFSKALLVDQVINIIFIYILYIYILYIYYKYIYIYIYIYIYTYKLIYILYIYIYIYI